MFLDYGYSVQPPYVPHAEKFHNQFNPVHVEMLETDHYMKVGIT